MCNAYSLFSKCSPQLKQYALLVPLHGKASLRKKKKEKTDSLALPSPVVVKRPVTADMDTCLFNISICETLTVPSLLTN